MLLGGLAPIQAVRNWPWIWLAPLGFYFALVLTVQPFRRTFVWMRLGRVTAKTLAVTIGLMVLASLGLVGFRKFMRPAIVLDPTGPLVAAIGSRFVAGMVFAIGNAILEEMVFRGILFDALESQWGARVTLAATALLFGLGHMRGYPPGIAGGFLATVFGLATGGLRLWSGGLVLPILAHIGADLTIFYILSAGG